MSKTLNGLKWPKSCFKCFKLVTKSSLPMSSQVMKLGSIILSPSERLAIKSEPTKHSRSPTIAKRSLSARNVWYAIFFSGEGVAIKVPVEKDKKTSSESTTKTKYWRSRKKYYQKRLPVTGFKHIRLLHGNVPAHASEIVTAFLKKEKVTVLPHLPYSLDLALCDFFMFPKLK